MKMLLIFMFLLFVGYQPANDKVDQKKPFDQLIEETNLLKMNVLELKDKIKP